MRENTRPLDNFKILAEGLTHATGANFADVIGHQHLSNFRTEEGLALVHGADRFDQIALSGIF